MARHPVQGQGASMEEDREKENKMAGKGPASLACLPASPQSRAPTPTRCSPTPAHFRPNLATPWRVQVINQSGSAACWATVFVDGVKVKRLHLKGGEQKEVDGFEEADGTKVCPWPVP